MSERSLIVSVNEVGFCWDGGARNDRALPNAVRPELNEKVFVWSGDVRRLRCDAVVVGRSSKGHYQTETYERILTAAGVDNVEQELSQQGYPRSGEARATFGYHLHTRYLIHVLRPRFPKKYVHAARMALGRCVSSALDSAVDQNCRTVVFTEFWESPQGEAHPFPRNIAANLFCKSLRSFLDAHAHYVEKILIVSNRKDDTDMLDALAKYFPRNEAEAVGFDLEDEEDDDFPADHELTKEESYRAPEYVNRDGTPRRPKNNEPPPEQVPEEESIPQRYSRETLTEIEALDAIKIAGEDSQGRPILTWMQQKINVKEVDMDQVFRFLLQTAEDASRESRSGQEFFVVYNHQGCKPANVPPIPWLWDKIRQLVVRFETRVKKVFIIGDFLVRIVSVGILWNLDVRDRVCFIDSTEQLLLQFPGGRLKRSILSELGA
uniref:Macro domain-containing protein n=1 Tax=Rhodosorus marinus TaxID=101924 RepID=A0A7S3ABS2_9RHOD|mmetsp:Transcript_9150/g.40151  ORF Transcript_9150/g.40151 Transcript_9150/m.40151 type:complete len:435 (+) Transcript_9150:964-2268(+)|eukprot:CAMPEP_0113955876 /NCGR_PEP_ID=MMETSP0011_2-20120614/1680_1 /TAXON_ID=101924 /ORGANISM="Rhodosorus marinus" /LENGTH=434 /DNA_ID=CAMNT_0000965821 /DNA_START=881 /DNA_END=2185 /DNA_ORIENTATION=+ /assembly_acc=CAM_ASM_000156